MKHLVLKYLILVLGFMIFTSSCNKNNINPNIPNVPINISINPSTTMFQELNTVGGWLYLDEKPGVYIPYGSRGIMVYRLSIDEFLAYERQPPNTPDQCCNGDVCTKLLIGNYFPLVKDTCTNTSYLLIDGSIVEGDGQYPLIRYSAVYDGNLLHIYN